MSIATRLDAIDAATAGRVERNIDLVRRHILNVIEDPSLLDRIPADGEVILIPADDAELAEANLQGGVRRIRSGEDITFLHVRAEADNAQTPITSTNRSSCYPRGATIVASLHPASTDPVPSHEIGSRSVIG